MIKGLQAVGQERVALTGCMRVLANDAKRCRNQLKICSEEPQKGQAAGGDSHLNAVQMLSSNNKPDMKTSEVHVFDMRTLYARGTVARQVVQGKLS